MPASAAQLLLHEQQISLGGVIPIELGGATTASAIATAAWLNVPTIDADYEGRAVPEITQIIPAIYNVNLLPIASSDAYGNQVIIKKTINDKMTERLGKAMAEASFGLVGQATLLTQIKQIRPYLVTHTLSKALKVGTALRKAREDKTNVIEKLAQLTQAKLLFTGQISKLNIKEKDGYTVGYIYINGIAKFKNNNFRIWIKNENILSWLNGKPYIACPDLITLIDHETYEPYITSQLKVGYSVMIFGIPSPQKMRSVAALKVLGPKHFGFQFVAKAL